MPYDGVSLDISPKSPLHQKLLDALNARWSYSYQRMSRLHEGWRKSEDQFLAYLPETETDAARRGKRENLGKPQYTTVVLPYTYAMLMSAHSYWTTVFLSRSPIFQYTGRHGESAQQVMAMEALIDYQVQVGRMLVPLYFWLLDAGKYGLGVVANYWCEEDRPITRYTQVPELDPIFGQPTGNMLKQMVTETIPGYHGSKLTNIRPYDYFPDPRVPLWDVQRGEFVSYLSELTMNALVRGQAEGRYINVDYLRKSNKDGDWATDAGSTGREQGSPRVELPNDDFQQLTSKELKNTGAYGIVTMYVDLIPREWGLGDRSYPEKWVFTVKTTGGKPAMGQSSALNLILGAQPHGSYHNKYPINVLEFEPEAYAFASRGMPQVIKPIQDAMDWLLNSHMYNVRKTINNQFLVDPSRVIMKDITQPQSGGLIRLRASAYGTDPKTAISQLQLMDVTGNNVKDIAFMNDLAQRAVGINDQIMGMIDTGGRKTAQEIRASSTFGVNRQKTVSELGSAMGFSPLSEGLVSDSQQYMDAPLKLRIVGDLILDTGQDFLTVDPAQIQGFYDYVPVDGTMPIDRYAQANLWRELLAGMYQVPQVAAQYDIGRIFAWVAKLAGLKNINQFKVQVLPPGMAPPGNVIPMPGMVPPPGGAVNPGQPIPAKQISGMGTSG